MTAERHSVVSAHRACRTHPFGRLKRRRPALGSAAMLVKLLLFAELAVAAGCICYGEIRYRRSWMKGATTAPAMSVYLVGLAALFAFLSSLTVWLLA